MKKWVLALTALILSGHLAVYGQQANHAHENHESGFIRCYTEQHFQNRLAQNPDLETREEFERNMAPKFAEMKANLDTRGTNAVITIPIIFHVVHNNGSDNINASFVNSQIVQLNHDFRRIVGTSGEGNGVDVEVEFCAATVDENGNALAEPGINRVSRSSKGFTAPPYSTNYIDNTIKPNTIWNPNNYCNVWLCQLEGGLLGYAQFPSSSGLGGLNSNGGSANTDGVVVGYQFTGSTTNPHPTGGNFGKGRTLTHEIGHYLGLRHIWGDGGCNVDDYCNDTPPANSPNYGCSPRTSCSTPDQIQNYMDYTDDDCMSMFTNDQKTRILTVMANSPRRNTLGTSAACGGGGGGGGDPVCNTTISSFPYAESFESGLGQWSQASGDDINWTRRSGGTPSGSTGPSAADDGSFYMYIEASSPNYPSKTAILDGPCFDLAGQTNATFSFSYNMNGAAMGSLNLQLSTNAGSSWSNIWTESGNQGTAWGNASVSLAAYAGDEVKLRFVGTTGTNYTSDICVDKISLTNGGGGGGGGSSCSGAISSFPYSEGFNSSFGAWSNATGDDFDWARRTGGTPSSGTGPSAASEGTHYIYVEASNPNNPSKVTVINGPCFDLSGESSATVTFDYQMTGSAVGTVQLQASDDNGASWSNAWSKTGDQGTAWKSASVDLSSYAGGDLRVRFVGTTGSSWQGDIAIDDFGLSTSGGGGGGGGSTSCITVQIVTDNYGSETSWTLKDAGGTTIASGSGYANNQTYTQNVCAPAGCFTFQINDSYGDGICCAYGNGSYTLFEQGNASNVYASGGDFGSSEVKNFCASGARGFAAAEANADDISFTVYPNPTRDILHTRIDNAEDAFYPAQLMDLSGRIVWKGEIPAYEMAHDMSQMPQGMYLLQVRLTNERTLTQKVSISR